MYGGSSVMSNLRWWLDFGTMLGQTKEKGFGASGGG